jgi:xanthine dehydrogenase accessory factor
MVTDSSSPTPAAPVGANHPNQPISSADQPGSPGFSASPESTHSIYYLLADLESRNGAGALCTIIRSHGSTPRHTGSKMLVYSDGSIAGTVGGGEMERRVIGEAVQAILDGKNRTLAYNMTDPDRGDPGVCGGQVEVYVEPLIPRPTLVVIGSGHVGKAVAALAHWLGFLVVVNDDRPGFCTPEAVPEADVYLPIPMAEISQRMEITPWTYLVLTTRGVNVDVEGLPALLNSPAAYIGVIGSQRRWATAVRQLHERGVTDEQLAKVRSPIGLELNAETPEEIAVSILAEIIMLRQGGTGRVMSAV